MKAERTYSSNIHKTSHFIGCKFELFTGQMLDIVFRTRPERNINHVAAQAGGSVKLKQIDGRLLNTFNKL